MRRTFYRFKEETDPKTYYDAAWPVLRHPYSNVFVSEFALAQMKAARENPKKFVEADIAFRITLAEASRNSALRNILSGMRNLLDVWIRRNVYAAEDLDPRYRRHLAIFEAIKKRNPEAAARAMEQLASHGVLCCQIVKGELRCVND